jgi:PKD repeat protein
VAWGDGDAQSLGAVSGSQSAAHVYETAGSYVVTATVTDVAGISQTVSSTVTVIPVPRPTILVTPTPPTQVAGGVVNFAIQITVPQGIGVVRTRIAFGDGEVRELGGATSATVIKVYNTPGQYTVRVIVSDTTNQETEGTTTVSITSPG